MSEEELVRVLHETDPLVPYLRKIIALKRENEKLRIERDAYAKAMAVALREGIFASKLRTKESIERILKDGGET